MFDKLDESNFELFAARHYINTQCLTIEEFKEDLEIFRHIKRLLKKYYNSGIINERIIVNHLVTVFNVFELKAGKRMLFYKIPEMYWPFLKTILLYLNYINDSEYASVSIDFKLVKKLRDL